MQLLLLVYVIRPQTRNAVAPTHMQQGCWTKHDIVFVLLDLSSALLFRSKINELNYVYMAYLTWVKHALC